MLTECKGVAHGRRFHYSIEVGACYIDIRRHVICHHCQDTVAHIRIWESDWPKVRDKVDNLLKLLYIPEKKRKKK